MVVLMGLEILLVVVYIVDQQSVVQVVVFDNQFFINIGLFIVELQVLLVDFCFYLVYVVNIKVIDFEVGDQGRIVIMGVLIVEYSGQDVGLFLYWCYQIVGVVLKFVVFVQCVDVCIGCMQGVVDVDVGVIIQVGGLC